jgi:hypothetical protein
MLAGWPVGRWRTRKKRGSGNSFLHYCVVLAGCQLSLPFRKLLLLAAMTQACSYDLTEWVLLTRPLRLDGWSSGEETIGDNFGSSSGIKNPVASMAGRSHNSCVCSRDFSIFFLLWPWLCPCFLSIIGSCNAIYQQNLGDQSQKKMRGLLSPAQ